MVHNKNILALKYDEEFAAMVDRELEKEVDKVACVLAQLNSSLYIGGRLYADVEHLTLLRNLHFLNLSSNAISSIECLRSCENVIHLNLSDNKITDLKHLENMKHLKVLELQRNQISVIEHLDKMTELEELNLSDNHLGYLTHGFCHLYNLMFCKKLKILHLENNFIKEEVISDFTQFDSLRELYFKPNPVIGDYETYRMGFVFFLNQLDILDGVYITNIEFAKSCVFIKKRCKAMQELRRLIHAHLYGEEEPSIGRKIYNAIYYTSIILIILPIILDPMAFIAALIESFKE